MIDEKTLAPSSPFDVTQPLAMHRALDSYISVVHEICPGVPREILDIWTLAPVDALAVSELLASVGRPVTVFDIGTFVGGSAFVFACHPAVVRVVSIDPNPLIADEINDKRATLGTWLDAIENTELRVQDVAALALDALSGGGRTHRSATGPPRRAERPRICPTDRVGAAATSR